MGSFIWASMLSKYPTKISGLVCVAGVVDLWYEGLLGFYNQTVVCNGFNKPDFNLQEMAKDNEFRKKAVKETN